MSLKSAIEDLVISWNYEIIYTEPGIVIGRKKSEVIIVGYIPETIETEKIYERFNKHITTYKNAKKVFIEYNTPTVMLNQINNREIEILSKERFLTALGQLYIAKKEQPVLNENNNRSDEVMNLNIELSDDLHERAQYMKMAVDEDELRGLYEDRLNPERIILLLVPYFVYDYKCEITFEGTKKNRIMAGTIAINGINRAYEKWDNVFETIPEIEEPFQKYEVNISGDEAYTRAYESVIELANKEITILTEKPSTIIVEKKRTRPKLSSIILENERFVYLPIWKIEGRKGHALVNGVTGDIIKLEQYIK